MGLAEEAWTRAFGDMPRRTRSERCHLDGLKNKTHLEFGSHEFGGAGVLYQGFLSYGHNGAWFGGSCVKNYRVLETWFGKSQLVDKLFSVPCSFSSVTD